MTSDLDIYRSAWLIIRRDGNDTIIHAAMLAEELFAQGYHEGQRACLRIV